MRDFICFDALLNAREPKMGSTRRRNSFGEVGACIRRIANITYRECMPDHLAIHEFITHLPVSESTRWN